MTIKEPLVATRVKQSRAGTLPPFDPTWDQATCTANGYFFCTVQNACLNQPTVGGPGCSGQSSNTSVKEQTLYNNKHDEPYDGHYVDDWRNANPFITKVNSDQMPPPDSKQWTCSSECADPIYTYEGMISLDEFGRVKIMRDGYQDTVDCFNMRLSAACSKGLNDDNRRIMEGFRDTAASTLDMLNKQMVDMKDGVATTPCELMSTYLGTQRDKESPSTRRTKPWGMIIQELDTYTDFMTDRPATACSPAVKSDCPLACTKPEEHFNSNVPDELPDPDLDTPPVKPLPRKLIDFEKWENKDKYSEEHESCLKDLQCTFEELEHPVLELDDDPDEKDALDLDIPISDITTGCANGTGLYDVMMTAIDSSIDMQFKNSRLDAKQFGEFYAAAMTAAMQTTTQFLVAEKTLELDAERVRLEAEKNHLLIDRHKYDKQLQRLAAEKQVLEMEVLKKKLPLELAMLVQQTKAAEKQVEKYARDIELTEAQIVATYDKIGEDKANNELMRAETKQKIEQMKVGVKTAKFDAILKKHQAYATKVQTEEAKATGASQRRVMNADVQTKNKQSSLYDQQRKTYIYGQRSEILKLMKDMWTIQIDTLGAEGMVVESIKGPELSAKLERAGLDVGL